MANLDDILTTQKNGVIAINNINQISYYLGGRVTSQTVNSDTVIAISSGRIVSYSITEKGSTAGKIYNSATVANASTSNQLLSTTATQEVGVYTAGLVFTNGLVVSPGTGQYINVTYSLDQ